MSHDIRAPQFVARLALFADFCDIVTGARGELSANMKTVLFGQFFSAGNEIEYKN